MLDQGGAECNDGCPRKRQNRRHRCRGEATCGQRQRWEGRGHQPREAWSSRSWKTEEVPPAASGRSMTLSRLYLSIPAPPGPQRSCPTWISDVWSTELGGRGGDTFWWLWATWFMLLGYGCPWGSHILTIPQAQCNTSESVPLSVFPSAQIFLPP